MSTNQKPRIIRPLELLKTDLSHAQAFEEARARGEALGPIMPSFPAIAEELCDAFPVGLTVLHGAPGTGKSALALQLAAEAGCPALYVSLEMAPRELYWRLASRVTSTYIGKFRRMKLGLGARERFLQAAINATPELAILDAVQGPLDEATLLEHVLAHKGDAKHCLVVVDSVSSWIRARMGATGEQEYSASSNVLDWLRIFAHQHGIAILAIAEQNRSQRDSKEQTAAAGTRAWEYGAEVMLALTREAAPENEYEANDEEENERTNYAKGEVLVKLTFAKNRVGCPGRQISLLFQGGFQRFVQLTRKEAEAIKTTWATPPVQVTSIKTKRPRYAA